MIFGRNKERETAALKVSVRHRVCRTRTHCLCSAAHLVGSQPATSASAADLLQFQNPGSDTSDPHSGGHQLPQHISHLIKVRDYYRLNVGHTPNSHAETKTPT